MSIEYGEWKKIVNYWRVKYGRAKPKRHRTVNLRKVRLNRKCQKCGDRSNLTRHHKGHEYLFARVNEAKYAPRYIEFREEDCVDLCSDCHLEIHEIYDQHLAVRWGMVQWEVSELEEDELEELRKEFVGLCYAWLRKGRSGK